MLDKRLLTLARFLETKQPYEEMANYLEMSQRNLARLLKKWDADGYITLNTRVHSGKSIELHIDIEKELFLEVVTKADSMKLKDIKEYLNLPWNNKNKEAILRIINDRILETSQNDEIKDRPSFIDYIYYIPEKLTPNLSIDFPTAQISTQIAETLYCTNHHGEIKRNLVKYDEIVGDEIHLHLIENIYFSDGKSLTSHEVKATLTLLKNHEVFGLFYKTIKKITVVNDYHLILHVPEYKGIIKFLLSEPCSVITRSLGGRILGTGPYKISKYSEERVELVISEFYRKHIDITNIYIINSPSLDYGQKAHENQYNSITETYASHDSLLFNPETNLDLKEREYFTKCLQKELLELDEISPFKYEVLYNNPKFIETTDLKYSIRILVNEYILDKFNKLRDALIKYNIELILVNIPYKEFINNSLIDYEVDCVWLSDCCWEKNPYKMISLVLPGKFHEWYFNMEKTQEFICTLKNEELKDILESANKYESWFTDNFYRVEMIKKFKKILYPTYYKDIQASVYGIIDYSNILMVE